MDMANTAEDRTADALARLHEYWQAANYLSACQIYLLDNPLLEHPLRLEHVKPRLLGHWGTTPGLNFIYAHLNRVIAARGLSALFIAGPGHGGPALVANAYLEGTYSERFPEIGQDTDGLRRLFRQFSFPGGIGSHAGPATPGSIHEGGELGYSLAHAYGAAFDQPDLLVACVVGDGEAETGALATSWHGNKFLNPARDGAVLPILHLNGYKIAGPTVLARLPHDELAALFEGYGYMPYFVEGSDPSLMHRLMAAAMDAAVERIKLNQARAREGATVRPLWPLIVLRSPKGWTGPVQVDGLPVEGSFRAHQVPVSDLARPGHLAILESWLRSYRPHALFPGGRLREDLAALAPRGARRMSAQPAANGGARLRPLALPDFRAYACALEGGPGTAQAEAPRAQGAYLRDVLRANPDNFRVFSPDETASNRWDAVFEASARCSMAGIEAGDEAVSPDGRIMEVLSEHQCQGWLEGYLLTGRHGIFSCYEAFTHIVGSMFNQHAKWLAAADAVPWRAPIASLNYMLTSHVWRQDHNGGSHQDPGFIDHVLNKKPGVVRVYLPPDANTLLCVTDHCLRSRAYVNVIVAGKQPAPQWLDMAAAEAHCRAGIGEWAWAGTAHGARPELVLACAGDVPTQETLAAAALLAQRHPGLLLRVVNVLDLMRLPPPEQHPHGLPDDAFDLLFPPDCPVLFAYHGYPALIHRLAYRRHCHPGLHVRGFQEEGGTTTPFDMVVLNGMDRYSLYQSAVALVPRLAGALPAARQFMAARLAAHSAYIRAHGIDMPEIMQWRWRPQA